MGKASVVSGRGAERRRSARVGINGQLHVIDGEVDGFLLDASDTGLRAVVWTHHLTCESIVDVVVSLHGRGYARRARVSWARQYREGSVVGLELLAPQRRVSEVVVEDEGMFECLPDEVTAIEALPLVRVGDPRARDVVTSAFIRVGTIERR